MRSLIIVLVAASHGAAALVAKKPSLRQPQLSSGSPSPRRARPSQLRRAAPTMGLADVAERPARAGMALAYVGFASAIATFPGDFSNPADTQMIMDAINDPSSLNPVFFFVFNSLGLLPAVNAALLLPGAKAQRPLPAAPFVASAFFAGFGGLGPYLILREPRPEPVARSDLGFFPRYVSESRLYGLGLLAGAVGLYATLAGAAPTDYAGYQDLFASSKLVSVSTVDFCILSLFAFEPIKEDMSRRGWWSDSQSSSDAPSSAEVARLAAFCLPVVGPASYVALRPALEEE